MWNKLFENKRFLTILSLVGILSPIFLMLFFYLKGDAEKGTFWGVVTIYVILMAEHCFLKR